MTTQAATNNRKRALLAAAIVAGVCIVIVLVQRSGGDKQGTVQFGVLMPLTGDRAAYGAAMRDAILMAQKEINQAGGVLGKELTVNVEDTKSAPREGLNAFEKLTVADGVGLVIGPMSSSEVLAVAPVAEARKVVLFTPSASSPEITAAGDYIFRNVPSDVFEGGLMASFAREKLALSSVAVLQIGNDYGYGVVEAFRKEFERLGGSVLKVEAYPDGTRDFRTPLFGLKETNAEAIYFVGYKEMGFAVSQARELGLSQQFLSTAIFEDPEILGSAGEAANGLVFSSITFDPSNPSARARRFVAAYSGSTGRQPDGYAASAYDAAHILAEAVKAAGTSNPEKVKEALYGLPEFDGLIGATKFNKNGDAMLPIRLKQVRDGRFESYAP